MENDEDLLNRISLIPVNPAKFPRIDHVTTMKFVRWLTAPEKGQKIIRDFGKDTYGSALFSPIPGSGTQPGGNRGQKAG